MRLWPIDGFGVFILLAILGFAAWFASFPLLGKKRAKLIAVLFIPASLLAILLLVALTVEVFGGHAFECQNFCPPHKDISR